NIPKEKDGPAWTELHVVDTKGNSTPFITGPVNVGNIAWTPDGKSIAFLTKREKDETRSLYLIGTRGGEARKILSHSTDIQGYSFSGDGKQVAFLAKEPITKEKKTRQDQGFNQEIYEEDQPPTRAWIADLPSPTRKQGADTPGSPRMLKLEGSASELHWNPKAEAIAVAFAPNALIDEHIMFRKVHIVDLKTGKATKLHNYKDLQGQLAREPSGKMGQLAWAPDSSMLALIAGKDKHDPRGGQLWIHLFTWTEFPHFAGHLESMAWKSKPGIVPSILFQASKGVWTVVGLQELMTSTGMGFVPGKRQILVGPGGPILSHLSASKNGETLAFIGHTPKHPPEVYYTDEKAKEPRRLTDSNPWLRTMQFAKQEVIRYKARDGLELEGILVRPLNEKKGQRYPLVLTVHGGPEAHYSNGWVTLYHSLGQVAAARGMAVFYPNYRGSTGYGVEFSMKGQRDAGGKEFDDLIDGVDHLVKMGLVDEKKVGITGGSYGGYATAWGATYFSDRFAAGVMFVGVSDWISCSGTTDIPHEMHLVHHRKWLWEDWDYFKKSSPISYLEKAKTPLLILHGKSDPRVHPSQSLELYRHLKVRGKAPVRLVLYPGEGHGNRRAASRLDYNIRLLQWMEHYLKGPGGPMPAMEIDYGLSPAPKTSNASWDTRSYTRTTSALWPNRGCPCCIGW
ncbi:MAG TPA: S9 family peptidase, partial [Gemmataceae bacterium]|nr:S9 family peptidase [Gemmataceae bacterium]